jgi:hypothetical protein
MQAQQKKFSIPKEWKIIRNDFSTKGKYQPVPAFESRNFFLLPPSYYAN